MIWIVIGVVGFAAWLSVVVFFVALCSAASRADRQANAPTVPAGANLIDLGAFRPFHERRGGASPPRASAFG